MLWTLLLPSALAVSPVDSLSALTEGRSVAPPQMALSCVPMGRVVKLLGSLPLPPGMFLQGAEDPAAKLMLGLRDPKRAEAMGFDLAGAGAMLFWQENKSATLTLPFSGDAAQAEALLQGMGSEVQAEADGMSWRARGKNGAASLWRLEDGALTSNEGVPPQGSWTSPALLQGMPEVDGCSIFMSLDDLPGEKGPSSADLAMFFPLGGGAPALVRIDLPKDAPALFASSKTPPVGGSSLERPTALLSVGVPLFDLLDVFGEDTKLPSEDITAVRQHVTLEPGATIAFYGKPNELNMVAVLPVTDGKGQPLSTKRLVKKLYKGAKRQDMAPQKEGKDGFMVVMENRQLHVKSAPAAVVVGTNGLGVEQAALGLGEPWMDTAATTYASEWPVAVSAGQSTEDGSVEAFMGLRSLGTNWEVSMEVKVDDPQGRLSAAMTAGLGMAMAAAGPKFQEMQLKAKRAEVPGTLDEIYAAELARQAAGQGFVALEPAPQAADALSGEEVEWTASQGWSELGWQPEGKVRGTYWVEVSSDGETFEVHGLIDADGDGRRAHYSRILGNEQVQHSAKDVY